MSKATQLTLEARKEAWADIKFRLQYAKQKVAFKVFEAYFLKSKEPNLHPMQNDPIPLVYRLWLSPDQSIEAWVAIAERVLAGPEAWTSNVSIEPTGDGESWKELNEGHAWGWQAARSLADSYKILMQQAGARHYNGVEPYAGSDVIPPLGFMGGNEKKIYEFMNGRIPGSEHLLYKGKQLFEPEFYFGHIYYYDACYWLDGTRPSNPFCIFNFMGDLWFNCMTAAYMNEIEQSEAIQFYMNCFLVLVARYPSGGVDAERAAYCSELRALLNAGPLLEPLQAMWHQAKNNRERIDLNAYMQDEPFYIGEF
ncbi:MAG: hypothetical protein V4812_12470 [Pseudomonadota bacterium]